MVCSLLLISLITRSVKEIKHCTFGRVADKFTFFADIRSCVKANIVGKIFVFKFVCIAVPSGVIISFNRHFVFGQSTRLV